MMARRMGSTIRRSGGIMLAVGGAVLIVRTVPMYLWPLLLGVLLIWIGWQMYIFDGYYW